MNLEQAEFGLGQLVKDVKRATAEADIQGVLVVPVAQPGSEFCWTQNSRGKSNFEVRQ